MNKFLLAGLFATALLTQNLAIADLVDLPDLGDAPVTQTPVVTVPVKPAPPAPTQVIVKPVETSPTRYKSDVTVSNVPRTAGGSRYTISLSAPEQIKHVQIKVLNGYAKIHSVVIVSDRGQMQSQQIKSTPVLNAGQSRITESLLGQYTSSIIVTAESFRDEADLQVSVLSDYTNPVLTVTSRPNPPAPPPVPPVSYRGSWGEDGNGYSRCYPAGRGYGAMPIDNSYCSPLRGKWNRDGNGYTHCYRDGSGAGARPIDDSFCSWQPLRGTWLEDGNGYTRCYPENSPGGTQPINENRCGPLVGKWGQDGNGYTNCYRRGSGAGAQVIDVRYCASDRLRGSWGRDGNGYTHCYPAGSGAGTQPIDDGFCR